MKLVLIPPGEFDMGSTYEEVDRLVEEARQLNSVYPAKTAPSEAPRHRLRITKAGGTRARRKPRSQLRRDATFLKRLAERQYRAAPCQEPPRYARYEPRDGPRGSSMGEFE